LSPGASGANAASAVAPDLRIESIDVLRGIALFGVLIVNLVTEFRVSIFEQFLGAGSAQAGPDRLVERIVAVGFASKAFCLFALLFGVGLAMQFDRLRQSGSPHYWLFRRLAVLLCLGLIHLLFIWNGDILTEYAIAGLVVLPLLSLRSMPLLVGALSLLTLHAVGPILLYSIQWPDAATLRDHVASANQIYSTGSLAEIWRFSLHELPLLLPLHISVFPRTLALFLLGAFFWRVGILKRPQDFKDDLIVAAIIGIAAGAAMTAADASRAVLASLAPIVLALGYGAAVMALTQRSVTGRLLSPFAPIGRMAFTNYLMQSVIFAFIFFGYGFGQFGRMGATMSVVIGISVYIVQLLLSAWWLRRHHFGPIEWLWRTLMYGVAQPMRKQAR
jgi:uncharacterized protein